MYSKAKIGDHPIHPMLVAFPITFYILTFVGFIVFSFISPNTFWYKLAYFSNFAAVGTALLAAIPGFIDWAFGVPRNTIAKKRGLIHMVLNLVTLALFVLSAYLIYGTWNSPQYPGNIVLLLTGAGALLVLAAGYYGWEMIGQHKVGVSMSPEQERLQNRYERGGPVPVR